MLHSATVANRQHPPLGGIQTQATHVAGLSNPWPSLAHRLCRVRTPAGVRLTWDNFRDQFGQEYSNLKDFKREFRNALNQVGLVYPSARIDHEVGGLRLFESPPPIPKTMISLALPRVDCPAPGDNSVNERNDPR